MKKLNKTSAYKTYAEADIEKRNTKSKTTQPTKSAVERMRNWSIENKQ